MSFELLDQNAHRRITISRNKISKLYEQFKQMLGVQYYEQAHKITFGFLVSEYVLKLKIPSKTLDSDTILLCGRRLLEVFIILKYITQTNTFSKMMEYCQRDRYDCLEGCNARVIADEKFFPELKDLDNYALENKQEQAEILKQYEGKKPKAMETMKAMATAIGYEEEYNYFYKFTSKVLHFCPFSLNGDAYFEHVIHKRVFLIRVAKYLEEIEKELENIYQSIPK